MHAISHTLAHRAPPASRTRARWQPYTSSLPTYPALSSSSSSKSSSPASDSTPATSVISPSHPTPVCDNTAIRSLTQNPSIPTAESLRDPASSKNKFALGLVDQAVKTLCEVWRPQDIPPAFSSPRTTRPAASLPNFSTKAHHLDSNTLHKLSSKSQSATHIPTASTTSIPTSSHSIPPATAAPALIQPCTSKELRNLVPIRGFVHEVLRRSRTSGCVLQTALCYLEAIRPKITELAHLERIGKGTDGEPESEPRIFKATPEEIERSKREEAEVFMTESAPTTVRCSDTDQPQDCLDTVRIEVDQDDCFVASDETSMTQQRETGLPMVVDSTSNVEETEHPTTSSAVQMPHLPSPLLCPRRAFLAALILASKFTQDKCYSNRAWAKLSGLPPREIGRCERALGSALEWRLWVGKGNSSSFTTPSTSPNGAPANRAVARCQSESSVNMTVSSPVHEPLNPHSASESSAFMPETALAGVALIEQPPRRTIRRASTVPSGVLSSALGRSSRPALYEIPPPASFDSFSSSTLAQQAASSLPTVHIHAASPTPSSSTSSTLSSSPSPDMPGLSYSPSSVSSSPSSSCSSSTDRVLQLGNSFDDSGNSGDFYDSPVARINTKLLVPGYAGHTTSTWGLSGIQLPASAKAASHMSPTPIYGMPDGILPPQQRLDELFLANRYRVC